MLLSSDKDMSSRPYLPQTNDTQCKEQSAEKLCFAAGEGRLNENLGLVSVQTLFMREHNRIADELASLNPSWSDDRLYNEAKRILTGVYQHIVYKEFLPVLLGNEVAENFSLVPLDRGSYKHYNPNANPSISSEFSTAAFRFGHTLVITK